jgi:Uma2 family endonuclease
MRGLVDEYGLAPVTVQTTPVLKLDDDQLFDFCQLNRDLRIERSAKGELLIMPPEGGSSGRGSAKLVHAFSTWAEKEGSGEVFGSSTGYILPNGAMRSPDLSWVQTDRLRKLTPKQWKRFLPLCPDFVLELRSESDSLRILKAKMEEYVANGAQLAWLLDPLRKQVFVYAPEKKPKLHERPIILKGDPVLKGFILDVPAIWAAIELIR